MVAKKSSLACGTVVCCFVLSESKKPKLKGLNNESLYGAPRVFFCKTTRDVLSVGVLTLDGPDARLISFEGVDVDHPVEDHGIELSSGCIAGLLRIDRST